MSQLDHEKLDARAERWIAAELQRLQKLHGDQWPAVRDWLESYVREEAKQKAAALSRGAK